MQLSTHGKLLAGAFAALLLASTAAMAQTGGGTGSGTGGGLGGGTGATTGNTGTGTDTGTANSSENSSTDGTGKGQSGGENVEQGRAETPACDNVRSNPTDYSAADRQRCGS